jgi:hypothetical protein
LQTKAKLASVTAEVAKLRTSVKLFKEGMEEHAKSVACKEKAWVKFDQALAKIPKV